jgi:hypothetical protein
MFFDIYCRCKNDAIWERLHPAFKSLAAPSGPGWTEARLQTHSVVSPATAGTECSRSTYTERGSACNPLMTTRVMNPVEPSTVYNDAWAESRTSGTLGDVPPATCFSTPYHNSLGYEQNECSQAGSFIHRYASLGSQVLMSFVVFIFLIGWLVRREVIIEPWFYSPAPAEESYFWLFVRKLGP